MGTVKHIYDTYGLVAESLDSACALLERAIALMLEARESSYRVGDYFGLGPSHKGEVILQRNYDDVEKEWTESKHQDVPFLLYVSESPRADQFKNALEAQPGVRHLRRELT